MSTYWQLVSIPREWQRQRLRRVVELERCEPEPRGTPRLDLDASGHEHELEEEEAQRPDAGSGGLERFVVALTVALETAVLTFLPFPPRSEPDREEAHFEQERVPLEVHERLATLHDGQVAEPHDCKWKRASPAGVADAQ